MVDRLRMRGSVRNAVVWQTVRTALADLTSTRGRGWLEVLDAGGGTGGFAVPLAELGHRVTVVDASPDSLAALERRAAEAGVSDLIHGVQGDAASLLDVVSPEAFDVVVCHSVLEVVDDPVAVLTGVAASVRSGGVVSIVAANMVAAVLHRAVAGRFDEALHALRDPVGRYASHDPIPRRFSLPGLEAMVAAAGLTVVATYGSRIFADLVPSGALDADPLMLESLITLEVEAAAVPALRDIATALHVLARRQ
jgi:S-adenosylmethionine-dependent methyltransferase